MYVSKTFVDSHKSCCVLSMEVLRHFHAKKSLSMHLNGRHHYFSRPATTPFRSRIFDTLTIVVHANRAFI